jgi:hypothetical protein
MFDLSIEEIPSSDRNNKKATSDSLHASTPPKKERMKRLCFRNKGTKKYKFTLEGEMGLNIMHSKTKTETSWILQVQNISERGYILDLVAYDIVLKECNNEGFKELFHITRQFQKLYDEIRVQTDLEGNLQNVLNQKQLIEKWQQIKSETIQYFNDDMNLDEFFAVNDEEFAKPEFLNKIVKEVEFFFLYMQLGGYGQKFSSFGLKELKRDNAFRTAEITWDLDFSGAYEVSPESPLGKMGVESRFEPDKKWLQKAYGQMPFIKIEELKPDFNLKGNMIFYNETGWIKQAQLEVNEIVHPNQLFHKMKYQIQEIQ